MENRIKFKKISFVLSVFAIIIWLLLGTNASVAWFSDTSNEVSNIFNVADFKLVVSYKNDNNQWEEIDATTKVFSDEALYEPGYVQVVPLKIENKGSVPFNFKTSVIINDYRSATNVYNETFKLQDYLKFGVVFAKTEAELSELIGNRDLAEQNAQEPLETYHSNYLPLEAGGKYYGALIVRMPKEVSNVANYDVLGPPKVELGIVVKAGQQQ